MEVAAAALGSILPKMSQLLNEENKLQKSLGDDLMFLRRHMLMMQAVVADERWLRYDPHVRIWVDEFTEVSFAIEDSMDRFMLSVENDSGKKRIAFLLKKDKPLQRIGVEINDIKVRVHDLKFFVIELGERRSRYPLSSAASGYPSALTVEPRMHPPQADPTKLVGLQEPIGEIIRRMQSEGGTNQQPLKILSIVGPGGVGKTTLAKAVYDRMRAGFHLSAWVCVGPDPEPNRVFSEILRQVTHEKHSGVSAAAANERMCIREIQELLRDKRYFIIVDDIWDTKSWERIRWAFNDCNSGSIVITTSRIHEVAARAGGVYKLEPLSSHNAEDLWRRRLRDSESRFSLQRETQEILQKCGGLPLAINTIAHFLSGKSEQEYLYMVSNSIDIWAAGDDVVEEARRIILLSYDDLPKHLRVCLLHLSIFPRNYMIRKDTLIWKWVAEGFIPENPRAGLFEMGEEYFNELINRSMIQPVEISHNGDIIGCRVDDVLHDIICSMAKERNFVTLLKSNEQNTSSKYNARRLALHGQQQRLAGTNMSLVRSFNAIRCDIKMIPSLVSFELLRVLAIEDCSSSQLEGNAYSLEHISRLLFLRYLGLSRTPVSELPEKVGNLKLLEILDVRQTGIPELPKSVRMLSRLKCLRADGGSTRVPDWIGNLTSLEELSLSDVSSCLNFVKEVGKLTMLRELKIWIQVLDERSKYALVKSLSNLQKIQVLHLNGGLWIEEAEWEGYVPPRQLRRLSLRIKSLRLPRWINTSLLPALSHLSVDLSVVEADDLEILGSFPGLITLELFIPNNASLDVESHKFPMLRHCYASGMLKFLEGAAPRLESVHFNVMADLHGASFQCDSLGNLPLLKEVRVEILYSKSSATIVEEALKDAISRHLNRPILHLSKYEIVL